MRFKIEKLLIFALIVRLLTLVLPWLTINLLFPQNQPVSFLQFTQTAWSRWDASHYLYLAEHGYTALGDEANFIVFFPLYPLILKPIIFILGNAALSGIITSIFFFLLGLYFFYKLIALDYLEKVAGYAVIALAVFPTSYFFNSPYTESLFLLIFSGAMYAARKENWILAGVITGLGIVTRPFGFLILPGVLTEWFLSKERKLRHLPIIIVPTIIAGLSYLYLNKSIFGNPLEFQKILAVHWQKHLVSPVISVIETWKRALSGGLTNYVVMVGWAEALTITLSWILIPFAFKYLRRSWAIFYTLSILLFSSTSFILSTPRYLLSIPPFFVLIALAEKNYLFKIIWSFISIALLISLAILFARGQWAF
jgi:Gpi18-like mannosyltransferase